MDGGMELWLMDCCMELWLMDCVIDGAMGGWLIGWSCWFRDGCPRDCCPIDGWLSCWGFMGGGFRLCDVMDGVNDWEVMDCGVIDWGARDCCDMGCCDMGCCDSDCGVIDGCPKGWGFRDCWR
jgi:hypothetical protein